MDLDPTGAPGRKAEGVDSPLLRSSGLAGGFWLEDDDVCTGRDFCTLSLA